MGNKANTPTLGPVVAFACAVLAVLGPAMARPTCNADCEEGRAAVATLVAAFERDKDRYLSRTYSEADLRRDFIDPFFAALGWDVANSAAHQLYRQDTVPEARLWKRGAVHYADYAFRIDGRSVFYTEVEAASRDVDDPDHVEQAVGYAWSSSHADIAVLTDFEEFRVYDVRRFGKAESLDDLEVMSFHFSYTELAERFPEIWGAFSKQAIAKGSLSDLVACRDPGGMQETVNEAFLKDLDRFRLRLGQAIYDRNEGIAAASLNEAANHILNQIVFGRVLEDRDIEPTGSLREAAEGWRSRGQKAPLWSFLRAEFGRLERRYNGVIFAAHFSDGLDIPNDVLVEIIDALYPPTSPYAFSIIPIDVLGRAYESYLGKRLVVEDGEVSLALRPEVRRAGGVFYTPEWVVDYILDQTLSPKLGDGSAPSAAAVKPATRQAPKCKSRAQAQWTKSEWHFPPPERRELFDAVMCQNGILDDIADISNGVKTGADKAFIIEKLEEKGAYSLIRSKATEDQHWVETAFLKPIIRPRDIRRYKPIDPESWVVFPYDGEPLEPMSEARLGGRGKKTLAYLDAARIALGKKKPQDKPWYGFGSGQSYLHHPHFRSKPKILFGWAPGNPHFTLDTRQRLHKDTPGLALTTTLISPYTVLGLLNSAAFQAYMEATSPELWNGFVVKTDTLRRFPIPPLNERTEPLFADIDRLARQVLKKTALKKPKQTDIERLEAQIDQIVYELYGAPYPEEAISANAAPKPSVLIRRQPTKHIKRPKPIEDLMKLKVLDPACGAGAFSVQMATRILDAALAYYAKNPGAIGGADSEFPDAYTLFDGTLKLSVAKKAELIKNTIFCVDVDPQAVEITRMWLYMLMLEDEASPILTHERRYKIPNRIWPPAIRNFKLPDLNGNVVNGNSLVGGDFSKDPQERDAVRAFDWAAGDTRLAQTVRAGGFDVIAGNPPYLRYSDAAKHIPAEAAYFRKTYESMGAGQGDMSYAFIEKGLGSGLID